MQLKLVFMLSLICVSRIAGSQTDLSRLPDGVTVPTTSAVNYSMKFKTPRSCKVSDCTVFVGIEKNKGNSSYLNFYIEGDATAWVAVGFSTTHNMPKADVMACNRIAGGEKVEVLDCWNPGYYTVTSNVTLTFAFNSNVHDGRIFCSFGRSIAGNGDGEHLNLDGDYYVLYGLSNGKNSSHVLYSHMASIPAMSEDKHNVVKQNGTVGPDPFVSIKRALVQTHGIFMLVAWILLVNIGSHFAWYMRLPLPNGEWFQVHRAVMIAALFVSLAGFVFIITSQAHSSPRGLINLEDLYEKSHMIMGFALGFLQLLNPTFALFRCKPGHKYRWIFNIVHGKVFGVLIQALAICTAAVGLTKYSTSEKYSRFGDLTLLWVFLAYVGISIVVHIILVNLVVAIGRQQCSSCHSPNHACTCDGKREAVSYRTDETTALLKAQKSAKEEKGGHKKPVQGSAWIWITMSFNIGIILVFVLALLVLITLPK